MTWTKRTSEYVSPEIDTEDSVINSLSETINGYGTTPSWTNRDDESTSWEASQGLWIVNYYPWADDAYPWQREIKTTNWNKRS